MLVIFVLVYIARGRPQSSNQIHQSTTKPPSPVTCDLSPIIPYRDYTFYTFHTEEYSMYDRRGPDCLIVNIQAWYSVSAASHTPVPVSNFCTWYHFILPALLYLVNISSFIINGNPGGRSTSVSCVKSQKSKVKSGFPRGGGLVCSFAFRSPPVTSLALRTAIISNDIAVERWERPPFTGWTQSGGSWGVFFVTWF